MKNKMLIFLFCTIFLCISCSNVDSNNLPKDQNANVAFVTVEGQIGTCNIQGLNVIVYYKDVPSHTEINGSIVSTTGNIREMYLAIENTTTTKLSFKGTYLIKGRKKSHDASGNQILKPTEKVDEFYDSIPSKTKHYYFISTNNYKVSSSLNSSTHGIIYYDIFNGERYSPCEYIGVSLALQ